MEEANRTSPVPAEADLLDLFRRVFRLMGRAAHRRDHAHHAQEHVLALIRHHGLIKQSELLDILDVRSSSLSEILAKLERNGLVARKRNERDKRGFLLYAPEGAPSASPSPASAPDQAAVRSLFSCFEASEQQQLAALLRKLIVFWDKDAVGRPTASGDAEPDCWRGRHGRHRRRHEAGPGCGRRLGDLAEKDERDS